MRQGKNAGAGIRAQAGAPGGGAKRAPRREQRGAVPDLGSAVDGVGGEVAVKRGGGATARTTVIAGGTQPPIHHIVTAMVRLRKLTRELINCFPHPGAKPALQTKGLPGNTPVSGAFFLSKIAQNRAKPAQKTTKNGRKLGFLATDFIKACQVRRLVSSPVSVGATRRRRPSSVPPSQPAQVKARR
jgi:hypothetical protein